MGQHTYLQQLVNIQGFYIMKQHLLCKVVNITRSYRRVATGHNYQKTASQIQALIQKFHPPPKKSFNKYKTIAHSHGQVNCTDKYLAQDKILSCFFYHNTSNVASF